MKIFMVLVLISFLLVGCTEIGDSFDNLKEGIGYGCKEKASELIPKYLILSPDVKETEMPNYWNDGTQLNIVNYNKWIWINCLRKGSSEGENINHYYPNSECFNFVYSKQVLDEEGNILGENHFILKPVLKLSDKNMNVKLTDENPRGRPGNDFESTFKGFTWSGFTSEVKSILNSDEVKITVRGLGSTGPPIWEESLNEESEELDIGKSVYYFGAGKYTDGSKFITISPDIIQNKIYEIIDYSIEECNWVD